MSPHNTAPLSHSEEIAKGGAGIFATWKDLEIRQKKRMRRLIDEFLNQHLEIKQKILEA